MKPNLDDWLRFIVGLAMALTLIGIVGVSLWSVVFVTQPMLGQAPNDAEFFKLVNPIATFVVGALSGVMAGSRRDKKEENK